LDVVNSDPVLSDIPSLVDWIEGRKSKLQGLEEPLADAIAETLSSFQESIISSKHYKTGMMSNSVDISMDGKDRLVGNTASSVDGFPYPLAIEKGSRDHWVAPVTYSALHWTDGSGEHWSKGHMVSGITADPFVQPSIDDTIYAIDSIVDDFLGGL
jgi:hypothetical protein